MMLYKRGLALILILFFSSLQLTYAAVNKSRLESTIIQAEQLDSYIVDLYNNKENFEKTLITAKKRLNNDNVKQSLVNKLTKKLKKHVKKIQRIDPNLIIPPKKPESYITARKNIETILGRTVNRPNIDVARHNPYSVITDAGFALDGGINGNSLIVGGQLGGGRIIACGTTLSKCLPNLYGATSTDTLSHSIIRWTTAHLHPERQIPTLFIYPKNATNKFRLANYNLTLKQANNITVGKRHFDPNIHPLAVIPFKSLDNPTTSADDIKIVKDYVQKGGSIIIIGGTTRGYHKAIGNRPIQSLLAESGIIGIKPITVSPSSDFSVEGAIASTLQNQYLLDMQDKITLDEEENNARIIRLTNLINIVPASAFNSDFWLMKRYNELKKLQEYPLRKGHRDYQVDNSYHIYGRHIEEFVMAILMPTKLSLQPDQEVNPSASLIHSIDNAENYLNVSLEIDFKASDTTNLNHRYGHKKRIASGYWLPAGKNVTVKVNSLFNSREEGEKLPLKLSVNAEWPSLDKYFYKGILEAPPSFTGSVVLKEGTNIISSEFGGLIYIDHLIENIAEQYNIELSNVYQTPMYTHGVTNLDTWRAQLVQSEVDKEPNKVDLVFDHLIVTFKREKILSLNNETLKKKLLYIHDGLKEFYDFIGLTDEEGPNHLPVGVNHIVLSPEFLLDYPYKAIAGFPIVFDEEQTEVHPLHSPDIFFHEIAHNYQQTQWLPTNAVESHANLMTFAVLDEIDVKPVNIDRPYNGTIAKLKQGISSFNELSDYSERNIFWSQLSLIHSLEIYTNLFRTTRDGTFPQHKDPVTAFALGVSASSNIDISDHIEAYKLSIYEDAKETLKCYPKLVSPLSWEVTPDTNEIPIYDDSECN